MVRVVLYVRQKGAIGCFWTKTFEVSDDTTERVLAAARALADAENLEPGGVDFIARDPATVPAIVAGEPVVQAGNPDVQGVVTRTGRTVTVEWRGKVGYGRQYNTYPDLAVFTRREDGQLVAD